MADEAGVQGEVCQSRQGLGLAILLRALDISGSQPAVFGCTWLSEPRERSRGWVADSSGGTRPVIAILRPGPTAVMSHFETQVARAIQPWSVGPASSRRVSQGDCVRLITNGHGSRLDKGALATTSSQRCEVELEGLKKAYLLRPSLVSSLRLDRGHHSLKTRRKSRYCVLTTLLWVRLGS